MYFEARTSLADMWRGNPVLTTVLFGLPLGFLTLIMYSICCADIMDADEDDEEGMFMTKYFSILIAINSKELPINYILEFPY